MHLLKTIAKRLLPRRHYDHLSWYRSHFGLWAALRAYARLLTGMEGLSPVPVPSLRDTVYLRPGTSDEDVFREVFLAREYDIGLGEPSFIIDAGAHIGLASLFFARRYPNATIAAIEAEPSNFALLCRNVRHLGNIRPVRAALWSHRTSLRIENPDAETWSFRVAVGSGGDLVPAMTVDDVVSMFGVDRVDVLKLDIEGAEREVLSTAASWIDRTDALIVELHDRFRPGCSEALERATGSGTFLRSVSGESIVLRRIR
jgi:FkbM family methyltransferase